MSETHAVVDENEVENNQLNVEVPPNTRKWTRSHPQSQIIGEPSESIKTRKATVSETLIAGFLSEIEPKKTFEALNDPDWILTMQVELAEFERNEVWKIHYWYEMGLSQQKR